MNISASQCSSGCESGWTLYLDQSSVSGNECRRDGRVVDEDCGRKNAEEVGQQDEEEDLSMVSDASSGPPHFHKDEDCFDANGCFFSTSVAAKKSQKKKIKDPNTRQQHSPLDDTASSPVLSSSKKKLSRTSDEASMEHGLDFSQGFSATHYNKGKSALHKHIDFSTPPSDQPGAGGFEGREWE